MESDGGTEGGELAGDGRLVEIIADADAQTGEEGGVRLGGGGDGAVVFFGHRGGDGRERGLGNRARVLDARLPARELGRNEALIGTEHAEGAGRTGFLHIGQHAPDALGVERGAVEAQFEELAGEGLNLFFGGGHGEAKNELRFRRTNASHAGELAGSGVVVSGAIGVGELLGKHALGGDDHEAGNLATGVGEHFLVLELDGALGLGD